MTHFPQTSLRLMAELGKIKKYMTQRATTPFMDKDKVTEFKKIQIRESVRGIQMFLTPLYQVKNSRA